jgi:hypothetical protein
MSRKIAKNSLSSGRLLVLLSLLSLVSRPAGAVLMTGRFSVGGFASQETFKDNQSGSTSNDFETFSTRMYLKLQKLGAFDAVLDLRDTHDFFDKLDAERLHLVGANSFQVREADIRYPSPGFYTNLGRFSILEAGSANVDGAEVGSHLTQNLRLGLFGGHNPRRPDDYYMRSDTPDVDYGAYLSYHSPGISWQRLFNGSLAYFSNSVNGFTDRSYLFTNSLYQWDTNSRIISNIYLDFVPRTFIQNGNLIYQQGINPNLDSTMTLLAFDTIEYSRRTGLLQQLPSSPYHEASLATRYRLSSNSRWLNEVRYGERIADSRKLEQVRTGMNWIGAFSRNIDMTAYFGYRDEFISNGPLGYFEANYFSRVWEFGFDVDGSVQQRFDSNLSSPRTIHPLTTELSVARIFSNALFVTTSVQYAQNELVTIFSAFFTLSYRFGTHDMAPLRDGAPPRRSL